MAIDCENDHCADAPQVIYPKNVIVPTEYEDSTLKHDLALIELSEPANMTNYVNVACLPTGDLRTNNLIDQSVEIAGWGYFDIDDPKSSPILQVVRLPVVEINKCRDIKQLEHYEFSQGQMCVGGIAGKGLHQLSILNEGFINVAPF